MNVYRSKYGLLSGTTYDEVVALARKDFNTIRKMTKRQPYVKSKYFNGDKVFVTIFWDHIMQKHLKERTKRLKLYRAGIDLLRNSTQRPDTITEATGSKEIMLHRFYGVTKDGAGFCVQVKHEIRTGRKDFMSVFARKV